ncbi:nucleotidyltransferase domain protein [archaeon BMS3Abin16]|nr:nucleotidyltransferase domain protein [archaeon BMS3Abin16]HDY74733.1 nucleotidyltransferase domain-containing protein [Euryarchaeota archaeon]
MSRDKLHPPALEKFLHEVNKKYSERIDKVILFGSYARGDYTQESDIDLLVVWKGKLLEGWEDLENIAADILVEYGVVISLKIVSPEEYKAMIDLQMPFIQTLEREGVVFG